MPSYVIGLSSLLGVHTFLRRWFENTRRNGEEPVRIRHSGHWTDTVAVAFHTGVQLASCLWAILVGNVYYSTSPLHESAIHFRRRTQLCGKSRLEPVAIVILSVVMSLASFQLIVESIQKIANLTKHEGEIPTVELPVIMIAREKQMQQEIQRQKEQLLQQQHDLRQRELQQQELRERQLREQAIHAQAQKEVQKEREEREKREARAGMTSQSPSDPRQSPANGPLPHRMGYPFTEPRPPSRDSKITPQSPGIVDPRDPRFAGQFTNIPGGPHPTDLRMGSSQAPSAFSPAAAGSGDSPHMYTPAEIQRLQQNGLIPAYPPGLRMLEPHMMAGHAPYMLPGGVHHLAYMAQQMDHPHLVDGRPPSRGSAQPPPNQPPGHNSNQNQTSDDRARQTMGPPSRPGSDVAQPGDGSLLSLLQRYPVMWQGILALKNDQCVVQMHFISGCQPLVKLSLPQQAPDNTMQPLRIAQRMRLEQTQLEGVAKRMTLEKDYCMMLALPCGRDHTDIYQQTRAMSTGFIQYLQQKQAAGIVNVADPGSQQPAYVVHIFPPCEFSQTTLSRLGFGLLYQVKDLAHLIVIIATVA